MCMATPLMPESFESGSISQSALGEWAEEAYRRRKSLVHGIADTKRMLLHLRYAAITLIGLTVLAAMHAEKTTTLYVVSILAIGHSYQNISKIILESILFVFVTRPFDVGDCCIIDGHQMIVEEMNILSTVFLRFDHKKICYLNSHLPTQSICNCSRNPDFAEEIEFSIDLSSTDEIVEHLKEGIEKLLLAKPQHWKAEHSVFMQGVEASKMKMKLNVRHRMNHHNFLEIRKHKSELLIDLKNVFQSLNIDNYVIP